MNVQVSVKLGNKELMQDAKRPRRLLKSVFVGATVTCGGARKSRYLLHLSEGPSCEINSR